MVTGTGIDIIEISRIRTAVSKWGDRFLERVFNPQEISYAQEHIIPFQHYAGRFAAKEAIYKALGDRAVTWKDITICNDPAGKPSCIVRGLADNKAIHISISHCRYYAVASAVVEEVLPTHAKAVPRVV
ncbi:MAG: holo-ACP synthase [Candidatus Omnitrophica bacterium]|nr:holo-ACP synthase [Candidatus Omnitrophota bacterium]